MLSLVEGFPIRDDDLPGEFQFTAEINRQHEAILAYLSLAQSFYTLQQCEFYFRRYPFAHLPVSKEDHIRNMCEMYFNRFYEFKERLKRCLNAVDATIEGTINTGPVLKSFAKDFDQELRARNSIHHHERFDDGAIHGIGLALIMGYSDKVGPGWRDVANRGYRRSSAEWAARVKRRSKMVETYLEAVAGAMLDMCSYLQPEAAKASVTPSVTRSAKSPAARAAKPVKKPKRS
ncbi:hypothetical protein CBR61_04195 [Porphyrobacter sp. CACIAM 03H1]|nr:hypothetical protein CBR61_04195 [Porphyrobacter sp. CACIAM 03H1]